MFWRPHCIQVTHKILLGLAIISLYYPQTKLNCGSPAGYPAKQSNCSEWLACDSIECASTATFKKPRRLLWLRWTAQNGSSNRNTIRRATMRDGRRSPTCPIGSCYRGCPSRGSIKLLGKRKRFRFSGRFNCTVEAVWLKIRFINDLYT